MRIFIKVNAILWLILGSFVLLFSILISGFFVQRIIPVILFIIFSFSFGIINLMYLKNSNKDLEITLKVFGIIFILSSLQQIFLIGSETTIQGIVMTALLAVYQITVAMIIFLYIQKLSQKNYLL